jgi:hypothetical protein
VGNGAGVGVSVVVKEGVGIGVEVADVGSPLGLACKWRWMKEVG